MIKPRIRLNAAGAVTSVTLSNSCSEPYRLDNISVVVPTIPTLDHTSTRYLEQFVSIYGIRAVLVALEAIAERCAETSVGNFNTEQAKQWAAWSVAIEACADTKLIEPGRE